MIQQQSYQILGQLTATGQEVHYAGMKILLGQHGCKLFGRQRSNGLQGRSLQVSIPVMAEIEKDRSLVGRSQGKFTPSGPEFILPVGGRLQQSGRRGRNFQRNGYGHKALAGKRNDRRGETGGLQLFDRCRSSRLVGETAGRETHHRDRHVGLLERRGHSFGRQP